MVKCISCGICDKRYFKILLAIAFIYVFSFVIIFYLKNALDIDSPLLKLFLTYIGMLLCFIPELILKKISQNTKNKEKSKIKKNKKINGLIEYIYTDLSNRIKFKDYIYIGFISLMLLLIDFINIYIEKKDNFGDSQYYFTELPFLLIISIFVYKNNFYRHQYLSIIIITLFGLLQYIIRTQYYYKFTSKFKDILIDFLLKIIIGLGEATFFAYIKGLMEYKYFSPYKICYIFGTINSILIIIIYFIISKFKCNEKSILCSVEYKNSFYFDNIYYVFSKYSIGMIISLFLLIICFGITKLLFNIIINHYSVCHIFLFLQNSGIVSSIGFDIEKRKFIILQTIIIYFSNIINIFFSLVFLEIIELNCCGLNINLKKNIKKRLNDENILAGNERLANSDLNQNDDDDDDDLD